MNRNKQIAERARGDGQARSLSNLLVTPRYLDPDYEIVIHDLTRGETGRLWVFSLIPSIADKPSFEARVDDGSPGNRRSPDLDIDITGVTNTIRKDFKAKRYGYCGHHNDRSPNPTQRIFDVKVATPSGKVFEGEVSFNVTFSVEVAMHTNLTDTVDAVKGRASPITRICNALSAMRESIRNVLRI